MATAAPFRRFEFQPSRSAFAPLPPRLTEAGAPSRLTLWLGRQRQRAMLTQLDDHLLADIGVSRAEALREARRWT